jgi:hypothetical protein
MSQDLVKELVHPPKTDTRIPISSGPNQNQAIWSDYLGWAARNHPDNLGKIYWQLKVTAPGLTMQRSPVLQSWPAQQGWPWPPQASQVYVAPGPPEDSQFKSPMQVRVADDPELFVQHG